MREAESQDAVRVRDATIADLPVVMVIENESFSDPWSEQAYRETLEADQATMHVAINVTGDVVGHAVTYFAADEAELATIAVAANARRTGVGRALLNAALLVCRRRGSRKLFLEVRESNAAARAMYGAAGFQPVGRRRAYYTLPTEDAVLMRLEIGAAGPSTDDRAGS